MKETKKAYSLMIVDTIIMIITIITMIVLIAVLSWTNTMMLAACLSYLAVYTFTLVLLIKALFLLIKVDNGCLDFYWRLIVELSWCIPVINVIITILAIGKIRKSMV